LAGRHGRAPFWFRCECRALICHGPPPPSRFRRTCSSTGGRYRQGVRRHRRRGTYRHCTYKDQGSASASGLSLRHPQVRTGPGPVTKLSCYRDSLAPSGSPLGAVWTAPRLGAGVPRKPVQRAVEALVERSRWAWARHHRDCMWG